MNKILGFLSVYFITASCFAMNGGSGVLADVGIFKFDTETSGLIIGTGKTANTYYDLKVGYVTSSNLYLGGIYSAYTQDNGSNQQRRTLYGLTVGYHNMGWIFDGSYLIDGQLDNGFNVLMRKGTGFGVDIGYQYFLNTNFFIGGTGSYKSYTFSEYAAGGVTTTADNKVKSELYPMILLGFMF